MMSGVDVNRLRQYREVAGLTQVQLGERLGVARQTVAAWEHGSSDPTVAQLFAIARALAIPVDLLLTRSIDDTGQSNTTRLLFRADRREELRPEVLHLLEWKAADYHAAERLSGEIPALPESRPLAAYNPDVVEAIAGELRDWLGVRQGPLRDVIGLLEGKGLKVILHPLPASVSGFSAYSVESGAVIFINENHPAERQYFTALHELGHLVLHRAEYSQPGAESKGKDPREVCVDHLAGALLLPRETTAAELHAYRGKWIPEPLLLDLKVRYWVSMRTVLYRAKQLGLITAVQMGRQIGVLNKEYGVGSEPGTVPTRQGMSRLGRIVYALLLADKITTSRAAEILALPLLDIQESLAAWLDGGTR